MAENSLAGVSGKIRKFDKKYRNLSFDDRMRVLGDLTVKRITIEKRLDGVETEILYLEHSQDIAEERIRRDRLSMALLNEIRQRKKVPYNEFICNYDCSIRGFIAGYIGKLRFLSFISIIKSRNNSIIEITKYGEEFK